MMLTYVLAGLVGLLERAPECQISGAQGVTSVNMGDIMMI